MERAKGQAGAILIRSGAAAAGCDAREHGISKTPIASLDACRQEMGDSELADEIAQTLGNLPEDGILKLRIPAVPDGLEDRLAEFGCRVGVSVGRGDALELEIWARRTPVVEDLTGREAPEPLQRVLQAAAALPGGQIYYARLPHVPHPLFPLLRERAIRWWAYEETDSTALLAIRTPPGTTPCRPPA